MLIKVFWGLRALIYKFLFLKSLQFPAYMGSPVFFAGLSNVAVGRKFRIYPGWRIEVLDGGEVSIDDDVSIGQGFHLISIQNKLVIGKGTVISSDVLVTNSDHDYKMIDIPIYQQPMINKITQVGECCFIGSWAKILAGSVLGKQCIVGANSVVKGTFPDYCVISGAPAKIIKIYDAEIKMWRKP